MNNNYLTAYLFAQPSFIAGMARVLDIGGVFDVYNESETADEADTRALTSDWLMVGQDINFAIEEYVKQK